VVEINRRFFVSEASDKRSEEFLKISGQFKLGALITESSHPVTAKLSDVAKRDVAAALDLLFQVDSDVLVKYREFAESGRAGEIKDTLVRSLKNGGRMFFTGCGSTGRLSIQLVAIWRNYWQRLRARKAAGRPHGRLNLVKDWEDHAFSVMAGGDYALIKSVEGFEDFAAFGKKQLGDLGVSDKDVVFAITEGGETSFVIGTAWKGLEAGAKVYFVYNNPDDVLCRHVERSREVIEDPRIEKINLTTGPMAITGSTRMQATTIQLCVLLTVLEMVVGEMASGPAGEISKDDIDTLPLMFGRWLEMLLCSLRTPDFRAQLAALVELEEAVYRSGHQNNYFADRFALDVLTDTTERSPTYCTPPFRKFDDSTASDSWAFLFMPEPDTPRAWKSLLRREPRCVEWSEEELRSLVGEEKLARTAETIRKISATELMRFRIGQDGLSQRPSGTGDSAVAVLSGSEVGQLLDHGGFVGDQLGAARNSGARTGMIQVGGPFQAGRDFLARENRDCVSVFVPVPPNQFHLRSLTRIALKLVLNALSTCTMVRLGRVMGNTMIWVVPSNLKLIDRSTRYIERLTGLSYEKSNRLLFEVIEYIEPRMKADQAYPPAVGLAVLRARHKLTNEEAERRLADEKSGA
jgi:N-acetylmuramic acid 6-phosphate etherase